MRTVHTLKELRAMLRSYRQQGKRIGLVPTMGNLHDGHISLVRKAREAADIVVTSIFVNPMQFGATEDLDTYPRTLIEDQERLEAAGSPPPMKKSIPRDWPGTPVLLFRKSVRAIAAPAGPDTLRA